MENKDNAIDRVVSHLMLSNFFQIGNVNYQFYHLPERNPISKEEVLSRLKVATPWGNRPKKEGETSIELRNHLGEYQRGIYIIKESLKFIDDSFYPEISNNPKDIFTAHYAEYCKQYPGDAGSEMAFAIIELEKLNKLIEGMGENRTDFLMEDVYNTALNYQGYLKKKLPGKETNKSGRPSKKKRSITEFLSCSEDQKNKVISILEDAFKNNKATGIVDVIKALETKDYYVEPNVRVELWDSLRLLFSERICADSNFNALYNADRKKGMKNQLRKLPQ